ncbi:MAG: response regulator transcription factor [Kiritimatiellae bacterium]|nr:response regulator transcription factor [Kiritimatiellia bacterium]
MAKRINLMLVDDQAILVDVLRRQFEADPAFSVVGVAYDGASACALAKAARPDAALLDVELKHLESGFDLLPRLRGIAPRLHVVMLSLYNHPLYAQRALELGADAYLDKSVGFDRLRATLLECARRPGGDAGPSEVRRGPRLIYNSLTERELHVVRGVVQGRLTKDMADEFGVSLSTVSTHLQRAKAKLGVKTRTQLIRGAAAMGIVNGMEGAVQECE